MPAGKTYEPIATTTLTSSQTSITFSSITNAYTDLVLIVSGTLSSNTSLSMRFNGDSGTNYSGTFMYGTGSSSVSGRSTNRSEIQACGRLGSTEIGQANIHIFNYSNTTTNKTVLGMGGITAEVLIVTAQIWRNTAAINSIQIASEGFGGSSFGAGTTFTLYGIAAA